MLALVYEIANPPTRLWIIGQSPRQAALDVVHLLLRVLLLTAAGACG